MHFVCVLHQYDNEKCVLSHAQCTLQPPWWIVLVLPGTVNIVLKCKRKNKIIKMC